MFRRDVRMPLTGDTRMLSLCGTTMDMAVYINGCLVGEVDRTNPYVDITDYTKPGRVEEILVRVRADSSESLPGQLKLISAEKIKSARMATQPVKETVRKRAVTQAAEKLPLAFAGGQACWLKLDIPAEEDKELWLQPLGHEIMVTVVNNGHVLGRLMPDSDINALFRSGDWNRVWMPKEWLRQDSEVLLLVEGLRDGASLDEILIDWR